VDLNQDLWDGLKEAGHSVGPTRQYDGSGLLTEVDSVPMTPYEARLVLNGKVTPAEIHKARSSRTTIDQ
jgi:hypothetical protein